MIKGFGPTCPFIDMLSFLAPYTHLPFSTTILCDLQDQLNQRDREEAEMHALVERLQHQVGMNEVVHTICQ